MHRAHRKGRADGVFDEKCHFHSMSDESLAPVTARLLTSLCYSPRSNDFPRQVAESYTESPYLRIGIFQGAG